MGAMSYMLYYKVANNSCCETKIIQFLLLVLIIALKDGNSLEVQEWKVVDL